jgi:putative ABC transport system permease protein
LETEQAARIEMVPVIMARYAGARVAGEIGAPQSSAEWATSREQRLTYLQELPDSNRIVEGELWSDPDYFEISMEVGYAESLGVKLGDLVSFRIQGVPIELRLTSLREVSWESFEINFFLVVEPGVLEEVPQFRLAAALLDPEAEDRVQNNLVKDYPNITFLRVRPIIEKVSRLLERIALAVRFLGSFTILAGIVILAGSVGASQARRGREVALLKTLGVTRSGIRRMFLTEFALSGLVAGCLGVLGAFALSWSFLELVLKFESQLPWWVLVPAILGTALLATLAGLAASARALRETPVQSLRA